MEHTFATAHALISSLKVGDKVRVTRAGEKSYDMYVSRGPRRSDGNWGSPESLHVTVTFGPGRYATEVGVDDLWRRRKGHGWIGGGTTLEKIDPMDPEVEKELTIMFGHLADDHGETDEELDASDREAMGRLARKALDRRPPTGATDNPHSPGCPSIKHRH